MADPSRSISHSEHGTLVLLLYMDDIILTGSSNQLLNQFVTKLHKEFAMKDLGNLHFLEDQS